MNLLAQLKRELMAFFYSPIAYVLLAGALVINGGVFIAIIDALSQPGAPPGAAMQLLFGNGNIFYWMLIIVVTPLITMRLVAEERHSGTLETLLTAPINDTEVIVAKYLAAVICYVSLWAPSIVFPIVLAKFSSIEFGPVLSGYFGTLIIGMVFLAIGLFFSTLTRNQIVAAVLSFATNVVLLFVSLFDAFSPHTDSRSLLGYMNLYNYMEDFTRGIVDSRPIIYNLSLTLFVLFCTVQALQARRWRG